MAYEARGITHVCLDHDKASIASRFGTVRLLFEKLPNLAAFLIGPFPCGLGQRSLLSLFSPRLQG